MRGDRKIARRAWLAVGVWALLAAAIVASSPPPERPEDARFGFVDVDSGWAATPRVHREASALAEGGPALFAQLCSPCHGAAGRGDGRNFASDLEVKPRDLTDPVWIDSSSDERIRDVVRGGSRAVGLSSLCPPWGRVLDRPRIRALVRRVRDLGK